MTVLNLKPDSSVKAGKDTQHISFYRIFPSLITIAAISAGLASLLFTIDGQWDKAVTAILVAAAFDALDGATARHLDATSEFGAQLDTLSDFLAFGVAPSVILYKWLLLDSGPIGWLAMIFYTSAAALRLARFNVEHRKLPDQYKAFFTGVPSPAGAGLVLLPLMLWLNQPDFFQRFSYASPLIGLWPIVVGSLMVSYIPTFSLKAIKIPANMIMAVMASIALLLAAFISSPWTMFTVTCLLYLASIPLSASRFRALQKSCTLDKGFVSGVSDNKIEDS